MTDDVVIETVYRVKNRRTGHVTLHDNMNGAQGAVREAVFIAEVQRLLAMQVDGATAKMLHTQSRAFIRLLAQYDKGFPPVAAGVGVCAAQDGSGDISIAIHGLACPHCGASRGGLHGLECPHRAHLAELPLQGTADEAAGLTSVPGADAAQICVDRAEVPAGVYWNDEAENFYQFTSSGGRPMGEPFFQEWCSRRYEFPTRATLEARLGERVSVEPAGKNVAAGVCWGCGSPIGAPHGIVCPTQNRT